MENGLYTIEINRKVIKILLAVIKYGQHAYRMDKNTKGRDINTVRKIIKELEEVV